ncbi:annexin A1-like [Pyxicephalus adspersus]
MSFIREFLVQAYLLESNPEQATQKHSGGLQAAPSYDASADAAALDKAIKAKGCHCPLAEALKKALSGKYEEVVLALLKTPAEYDAEELKHATKGLGTDEDTLIEILASRNNREIKEIQKAYKELFKTDLAKDITSDTSGDFQKALLAILEGARNEDTRVNEELADNDARALFEAGEQKKRADVSVFINILTSRSFPHLRSVFQKYTKYSKHDVNKVLDLELKGDIEKLLTAIVKCATSKPAFFAERLNFSMKGSGTKDKILIRNVVSRSEIDMNEIRDQYKRMYSKSLRQDILDDTKGDYEAILLALVGGA